MLNSDSTSLPGPFASHVVLKWNSLPLRLVPRARSILVGPLYGAYHSKCPNKVCVCVCLVTLGVNAATTVGIKWHHVGRNTECFLMRDTPLNSARVLLPASHFIRTNYLKSRLQLCFTLLSEERVAPPPLICAFQLKRSVNAQRSSCSCRGSLT